MTPLIDALTTEIERVQELITLYASLPFGGFAVMSMRQSIIRAQASMVAANTAAMCAAYEDLKEYTA